MSFKEAMKLKSRKFEFGLPQLDKLIDHKKGLLLFRTNSRRIAFKIGSKALLENITREEKEYFLHFVEYHKRYWTIDLDHLMEQAERKNIDQDQVMDNIYCIRAFNSDQVEEESNWELIKDTIERDTSLIVVDSMEELQNSTYNNKEKDKEKGIKYLIGKLHQLGIKSNSTVLVFDYSAGRTNPYLMKTANTVLEADISNTGLEVKVEKGGKQNIDETKKHTIYGGGKKQSEVNNWS